MAKESKDLLEMSVREFAQAVAAKTPTPGGGSVAGVVAAMATALGEMSLVFTSGKKKYAKHQDYYDRLAPRLAKATAWPSSPPAGTATRAKINAAGGPNVFARTHQGQRLDPTVARFIADYPRQLPLSPPVTAAEPTSTDSARNAPWYMSRCDDAVVSCFHYTMLYLVVQYLSESSPVGGG